MGPTLGPPVYTGQHICKLIQKNTEDLGIRKVDEHIFDCCNVLICKSFQGPADICCFGSRETFRYIGKISEIFKTVLPRVTSLVNISAIYRQKTMFYLKQT